MITYYQRYLLIDGHRYEVFTTIEGIILDGFKTIG